MPRTADRVPPPAWFVVSATFHYLGPAFAVLLFARVDVLGVAWLRIASAALLLAAWRRPWRAWGRLEAAGRRLLVAWGAVLALMNACFYEAIDRLPLATVAAVHSSPRSRRGRTRARLLVGVVGGIVAARVARRGADLTPVRPVLRRPPPPRGAAPARTASPRWSSARRRRTRR
jgi:hypothetical protein